MAKGANEIRQEVYRLHGSSNKSFQPGDITSNATGLFEDERSDIQRRLNEFYFSRIGNL